MPQKYSQILASKKASDEMEDTQDDLAEGSRLKIQMTNRINRF
jgi:hypothetical protein